MTTFSKGISHIAVAVGLTVLTLPGAFAQDLPVDSRDARGMLFDRKGGQVVVLEQDFLTEAQVAQLAAMGGAIPYYGAVAMAPDEGMLSETNQAAANHHSIAAAETAALAACNTARSGGQRCVIVLHFLPNAYESGRALELSQSATEEFRTFRRGRGEKAFAISPSTGSFASETGAGAESTAIAACNAGADGANVTATDCYTVIVN
ncbi:hypothetical protein [Halocynthiibacter namhaensis]|uniref:hypothetical protein n=1 Tax=Halocynthiibacter namhaensis TaxID=1290553 RepID=UPI00068FDAD9|nr:hypothetical protein [Halocynthiibacter namhaensis]